VGIGGSDADSESHFLHAFLEMLLRMRMMRQVRRVIREKILSEIRDSRNVNGESLKKKEN